MSSLWLLRIHLAGWEIDNFVTQAGCSKATTLVVSERFQWQLPINDSTPMLPTQSVFAQYFLEVNLTTANGDSSIYIFIDNYIAQIGAIFTSLKFFIRWLRRRSIGKPKHGRGGVSFALIRLVDFGIAFSIFFGFVSKPHKRIPHIRRQQQEEPKFHDRAFQLNSHASMALLQGSRLPVT